VFGNRETAWFPQFVGIEVEELRSCCATPTCAAPVRAAFVGQRQPRLQGVVEGSGDAMTCEHI
jgi:hypothetical protein